MKRTGKKLYGTMFVLLFLGAISGCGSVKVLEITSQEEVFSSLTKLTESTDAFCPFGGDDNGPLFFVYQAKGVGQSNIYKKEKPLSGSMTQVTSTGTAFFPTYCMNIDKVAFSMGYDIFVMPATRGKALTQITSTSDCREDHPCFSHDGKYLVYDRIRLSNGYYLYSQSEIWLRDMTTGENTLLAQGCTPSVSFDGKKIVYCKVNNGESAIWTMDIDGENQSKITDNNTIVSAQRPRFSPDGNFIVFDGSDKKGNMDIYVISTNGVNLTRLTMNKSTDSQPYWSTDGYIYFSSDRGEKPGNYNIWRFKY